MAKAKKKPELRKVIPKVSSFSEGLNYPLGVPKRLLNILWALIPFVGWLALVSYSQSIIRVIVAGNKTSLPEFIGFGEHLRKGFLLFIKSLPLLIAYSLIFSVPGIGGGSWFYSIRVLPALPYDKLVRD